MRQTYVPHEDTGHPTPDIQQIPALVSAARLVNVTVECHYGRKENVLAAVPTEMTLRQLQLTLETLLRTEPEMTHFTVRASVQK